MDALRIGGASLLALVAALAAQKPAAAQQQTCGTLTTCPQATAPLAAGDLMYLVQRGRSTRAPLSMLQQFVAPSSCLNLLSYGADRSGAQPSDAAVAAWVAAMQAQKTCGYAPTGRYRMTQQLVIDLLTIAGTGLSLYGDGVQMTVFDFTGVSQTPNALVWISGGTLSAPAGAFYIRLKGIGFNGSAPGPVLALGDENMTGYLNNIDADVWVGNSDSSASCVGLLIGGITGPNYIEAVANCNGHGDAIRLIAPAFSTFAVSAGHADNAIHMTSKQFASASAAAISANTLTIGGTVTGTFGPGQEIVGAGVRSGTTIVAQTGGATFTVSGDPQTVAAESMVAQTPSPIFGNAFIANDYEVVNYDLAIDAPHAAKNSWLGGQFGYSVSAVNATAGSENVAYNPNYAPTFGGPPNVYAACVGFTSLLAIGVQTGGCVSQWTVENDAGAGFQAQVGLDGTTTITNYVAGKPIILNLQSGGSYVLEVDGAQIAAGAAGGWQFQHDMVLPDLPTSCAGKPTGALWNDAGTAKVCP